MATSTPIMITDPKGGSDGVGLEQCYFEEVAPFSDEFHFFSPGNDRKKIQMGTQFSSTFLGLNWKITLMAYTVFTGHGYGTWSTVDLTGEDGPESGTFQTQGGPGADDELSASASASA